MFGGEGAAGAFTMSGDALGDIGGDASVEDASVEHAIAAVGDDMGGRLLHPFARGGRGRWAPAFAGVTMADTAACHPASLASRAAGSSRAGR